MVDLVKHQVEKSAIFEAKKRSDLIMMVIRLNDLTKIANSFDKFKTRNLKVFGQENSERIDNFFDDYFRELVGHINDMADAVALFILKSEIEQDIMIFFFTNDWREKGTLYLEEALQSAHMYLTDVRKMTLEERFASKVAESCFSLLIDAYIERFIIAVNQRFKLRLPMEKVLIDYIYNDSRLKKANKNKIIQTKVLLDFF